MQATIPSSLRISLAHLKVSRTSAGLVDHLVYYSSALAQFAGTPLDSTIVGEQTSTPLDHDEALRLVGEFSLTSGDAVTVSLSGEELHIRIASQPPLRLFASAADDELYFSREAPIQASLSDDDATLILIMYGSRYEAARRR